MSTPARGGQRVGKSPRGSDVLLRFEKWNRRVPDLGYRRDLGPQISGLGMRPGCRRVHGYEYERRPGVRTQGRGGQYSDWLVVGPCHVGRTGGSRLLFSDHWVVQHSPSV